MVLYPDVLAHLLPFLPLQDQMRFSRVCHSWQGVGARAPALKVLRNAHVALQAVDALSAASFVEVHEALEKQLLTRNAQARLLSGIIKQMEILSGFLCTRAATAGLLPLLQSVLVQRVERGRDGSHTIFFTVEEPEAVSACSRRVVRLSARCSREGMGTDIDRTHWRICAALDPQQPDALMITLQVVCHWHVDDDFDIMVQPLANWLRQCGALRGSYRQQHRLLHAFLETVYGLMGESPLSWLDVDALNCRCSEYFPQQNVANVEPASEPDEEEPAAGSQLRFMTSDLAPARPPLD